MDFGSLLAGLRRGAGLSQAALAARAGLSQRHVSFLESGRSRPGRAALDKLARAFAPDHAAGAALFEAAGLAAPRAAVGWADPAFAPARAAIERALARHAPYPALALDAAGAVLAANAGAQAALAWAFDGRDPWAAVAPAGDGPSLGGAPTLYDLSLHPDGLARLLVNPDAVLPHAIRRLKAAVRREAALGDAGPAMETLRRVRGHPAFRAFERTPEPPAARTASVVVERYRKGAETLSLVALTARFGAPEDAAAQAVELELFYPEDDASAALLARLAAAP